MTLFEKLKKEPIHISIEELRENKKSNVFYCNFKGGILETKENIKLIAEELNMTVVWDYARMLAELKERT